MAKYRVYYLTTNQFVDVEASNDKAAATSAKARLDAQHGRTKRAIGIVVARRIKKVPRSSRTRARRW